MSTEETKAFQIGPHTLLILRRDGTGYLSTGDAFYDEELSFKQLDQLTYWLHFQRIWRHGGPDYLPDEPPTPQDP